MTKHKSLEDGILEAIQDRSHPDFAKLINLPSWVEGVFDSAKDDPEAAVVDEANRYLKMMMSCKTLEEWEEHLSIHPPTPREITYLLLAFEHVAPLEQSKKALNQRHKNNRAIREKTVEMYRSGKYPQNKSAFSRQAEEILAGRNDDGPKYETIYNWLKPKNLTEFDRNKN
jgi:hypothetical protein